MKKIVKKILKAEETKEWYKEIDHQRNLHYNTQDTLDMYAKMEHPKVWQKNIWMQIGKTKWRITFNKKYILQNFLGLKETIILHLDKNEKYVGDIRFFSWFEKCKYSRGVRIFVITAFIFLLFYYVDSKMNFTMIQHIDKSISATFILVFIGLKELISLILPITIKREIDKQVVKEIFKEEIKKHEENVKREKRFVH